MVKQGPLSFAERGIVRILAPQLPAQRRDEILSAVRAEAPLELSQVAQRNVQSVEEIYTRRGFVSPDPAQLRSPEVAQWDLEYADCDSRDAWVAAAFLVGTRSGVWRVVVERRRQCLTVGAAYPTVGGPDGRWELRATAEKAEMPTQVRHVKEGNEEWIRLKELGGALTDAHKFLNSFLDKGCLTSMRSCVWDTCRRLQKACREDLPRLSAELEWSDGEEWQPWARRAFDLVSAACDHEVLCVPVQSVNFTHGSISKAFRHGLGAWKDLEVLVEDLRKGRVDPLTHDDLVLDTVRYRGKLHSLNNRRLWALQQHHLMLLSEDAVTMVRVRVLPWTSTLVLKKFSSAFDSDVGGESIRCRTVQDGAPIDGVVASTLARAVLATPQSLKNMRRSEKDMLKHREQQLQQQGQHENQDTEKDTGNDVASSSGRGLKLGDETFADWREAQARVQHIMQSRTGGRPVPAAELRLLLDVFAFHPNAHSTKRIQDVISVTVGSSEKYVNTPSFWIWRRDGTGEDISVIKCWKKIDLFEKTFRKNMNKREVVADAHRFAGRLRFWSFDKKEKYGTVELDEDVWDGSGSTQLRKHAELYVQWADISPSSQARAARAPSWPFPPDTALSFVVYRLKENGKFGCMDVSLVEDAGAA